MWFVIDFSNIALVSVCLSECYCFCTELLEFCSTGIARNHELSSLKQSSRRCTVPASIHPLTKDVSIPVSKSLMTSYLVQDSNTDTKTMRMTTSSEEDSQDDGEQHQSISDDKDKDLQEHHKDDQHKRDTTTAQVSDDEYIPHGIVEVVNAMIKELNDTYSPIPDVSNRKAGDLYQAYHSVLRSKLMWSTKTVESHLLSVQAVLSKRQHCLSSWYYVCGQASTESNGVARSVRT